MSDVITALKERHEKTIKAQARRLVRELGPLYPDDPDNLRAHAGDTLAGYLLQDEDWEPVAATEISDIAYEAVEEARCEARDWAATQRMVADMERDGLL